jgi:hypothetical protein
VAFSDHATDDGDEIAVRDVQALELSRPRGDLHAARTNAMSPTWRMPQMCADCPFATTGPGRRLALSLRPGRMAEIKRGLRRGEHFTCHRTTEQTGNGTNLVCAGALAYQVTRRVTSNLQRIMERLAAIHARER